MIQLNDDFTIWSITIWGLFILNNNDMICYFVDNDDYQEYGNKESKYIGSLEPEILKLIVKKIKSRK